MMELAVRFTFAAAQVLWVGALVALGLFAIERLLIRSAAARHRLYLLGMILTTLVLPIAITMAPVPTVAIQSVNSKPTVVTHSSPLNPVAIDAVPTNANESLAPMAPEPGPKAQPELPIETPTETVSQETPWAWETLAPWAAGAYVLGLCLMMLRMLCAWGGSAWLWRHSEPVEAGLWIEAAQRMSASLGVRMRPALQWSRDVAAPVVIGFVKPAILLPLALANRLSPEQVEAVLAHELAHLRRLDTWSLALQRTVETVLFFHPAVWWMSHRVTVTREEACDDLVMASGCNPADYAEALVICSQWRLERKGESAQAAACLAATGDNKKALHRRILRLLGNGDDGRVRLGRTGWVLGFLLVLGVMLSVAVGQANRADQADTGSELPELSRSASRRIEAWAQEVVAGKRSEADFLSRVEQQGPQAVRSLVPLMKSGGTDVLAIKGIEQFLNEPMVVDYLAEVLHDLAGEPQHLSPNTRHCCLVLLGKSKEAKHVDLIASFLETNDNAAMSALAEIGGDEARDYLIGAFERIPTEEWCWLAKNLEKLGDAAAIPELERRLATVELPPSDRFPRSTVSYFTHAIATLSGENEGSYAPNGYSQGQHFRYPFDGPGAPKTFSVKPLRNHYVHLPEVDPNSQSGRDAIWKALEDATAGPGFTMDGNEVVVFHGLKLAPLWPNGPPYPTSLYDWLRRTSHKVLLDLIENQQHKGRYPIPGNGLMVAQDPDKRLYVLTLKKTGDDFQYQVVITPQNPSMQLIPARPTIGLTFTEYSRCTLHDLESEVKNGSLNLSHSHMETLTAEKWRTPPTDALLVAEFASNKVGLGIPGAKQFLLIQAGEEASEPEKVLALLKQAAVNPNDSSGHHVLKSDGALFHQFSELKPGQRFAFAVDMPNTYPVAGVIEIRKVDHQAQTLEIRHCYLPTVAACEVWELDKVQEHLASTGPGEEEVTLSGKQNPDIVWDKARRGWQVGARLLSTTSRLEPGDPVVVQLLLKNVSDQKQTVVLQQIGGTHPALGENGRISMNISGDETDRHKHVMSPGEILERPQYRVVLSTQGMLPGEYEIDPQPAFWQPDPDDENSATGLGRKTPIRFTLGDPASVTYSQPPVENEVDSQIHWGDPVSGLVVGMRLPQGQTAWPNNSRIKGEMFICNVSDGAIQLDYEVPSPGEWNTHVQTSEGKDVRLDRVWFSGFRQRVTRSLTLQPGQYERLDEGVDPVIQVLPKKTPFQPGDPSRLITSGGQYLWQSSVTIRQTVISDLTMVVGSGPVPFEIKEPDAHAEIDAQDNSVSIAGEVIGLESKPASIEQDMFYTINGNEEVTPQDKSHQIRSILKSLKQEVVSLSQEYPQLAGAKDNEVTPDKWSFQHDCRYMPHGYEETGPFPVAIGLKVMTLERFYYLLDKAAMTYPTYRWDYLGLVGWRTLHDGNEVPTALTEKLRQALDKTVAQFGSLNRQALEAGLPEPIRVERDRLLAQADRLIRQGVQDLAKSYPSLKQGQSWGRLKGASDSGYIGIYLRQQPQGKAHTDERMLLPSDVFSILVAIKQPPDLIEQMELSPLYPTLGLVGQVNTQANDENLDAALKQLVSNALAPLAVLEKRARFNTVPAYTLDEILKALGERSSRYQANAMRFEYARTANDLIGEGPRTEDGVLLTHWNNFCEEARQERGSLTVRYLAGNERAEVEQVSNDQENRIRYFSYDTVHAIEKSLWPHIHGPDAWFINYTREVEQAGNLKIEVGRLAQDQDLIEIEPQTVTLIAGGYRMTLVPEWDWAITEYLDTVATGHRQFGDFWFSTQITQQVTLGDGQGGWQTYRDAIVVKAIGTQAEIPAETFKIPEPKPGQKVTVAYPRWASAWEESPVDVRDVRDAVRFERTFTWSDSLEEMDARVWQISQPWRDWSYILSAFELDLVNDYLGYNVPVPFLASDSSGIVWAAYNASEKRMIPIDQLPEEASVVKAGLKFDAGFIPEKSEVMVDESIYVTFYVRNTGNLSIYLETGGDGRSIRSYRFQFAGKDEQGRLVRDPHPNPGHFGGLQGMPPEIKPGQMYSEKLQLAKWLTFERPGQYTIRGARKLQFCKKQELAADYALVYPLSTAFRLTVLPQSDAGLAARIETLGQQLRAEQDESNARLIGQLLADLGDERVIDHLLWAAERWSGDSWALYQLEAFKDDPRVIALYREALVHSRGNSRRSAAARLMGQSSNRDFLPDLLRAFDKEQDRYVLTSIASVLGEFGDSKAVPILEMYRRYHDPRLRLEVEQALVLCGEPLDVERFQTIIRSTEATCFSAASFVSLQAGDHAARILAECVDFEHPDAYVDQSNPYANPAYRNGFLLKYIAQAGGPEFHYNQIHNRPATPEETEANRQTLLKVKQWLKE